MKNGATCRYGSLANGGIDVFLSAQISVIKLATLIIGFIGLVR